MFTTAQKEHLKREIVTCLAAESEVKKIVLFGSFLRSSDPHDLDIAVFQDSVEGYLELALKYRKKTRPIARLIPVDIFPIQAGQTDNFFLSEIKMGEVIYEKS